MKICDMKNNMGKLALIFAIFLLVSFHQAVLANGKFANEGDQTGNWALVSVAQQAAGRGDLQCDDNIVWRSRASANDWIRDPSIFELRRGVFVLTGTRPFVVEYKANSPREISECNGISYKITLYSPGGRNLRDFGFKEWGKSFFRTSGGIRMLTSLNPPKAGSFDHGSVNEERPRGLYLFKPRLTGKNTANGFPLEWIMVREDALLNNAYAGRVFQDESGALHLINEQRFDKNKRATCMVIRGFDTNSLRVSEARTILCPGLRSPSGDWVTDSPFGSEIRFDDGGGLVEGGWFYYDKNAAKYYLFYSAGDYASEEKYSGFVAVCKNVTGPCEKIKDKSAGDIREFVKGSSNNYVMTGRPYPVVDEKGELVDINFNARSKKTGKDEILRCKNFTTNIVNNFVAGKAGCLYDE